MEVGLKEVLRSRGETMKEVSHETGISQNTLSLLNQGKSSGIKFKTLEKLCAYLQCTPNDLLKIDSETYTIGTIEDIIKMDGLVQMLFYITPALDEWDKAYLVVGEYWAAEFEQTKNPIFNITVGMPVHHLGYFKGYYDSAEYYKSERTANFLQNLSPSKAKDIALKIGNIMASKINNSCLVNVAMVSSYDQNRLICKGTFSFTRGDNASILPF